MVGEVGGSSDIDGCHGLGPSVWKVGSRLIVDWFTVAQDMLGWATHPHSVQQWGPDTVALNPNLSTNGSQGIMLPHRKPCKARNPERLHHQALWESDSF